MAKKNKMYDLGILGKWSEDTLIEGMELEFPPLQSEKGGFHPAVERTYMNLKEQIEKNHPIEKQERAEKFGHYPIEFILPYKISLSTKLKKLNVKDLFEIMETFYEEYKEYKQKMDVLREDFWVYQKVCQKLVKKLKKQKKKNG